MADTLGDIIRKARLAKKMTQADVAAHFGISKAAVAMWEVDKNHPEIKRLPDLARLLGLDVRALLIDREPDHTTVAEVEIQRAFSEGRPLDFDYLQAKPDLPVWAAAQAGDHGAIIITPDPIEYIRRSERMQSVKNPWAFFVTGRSMEPAIRHGDQVVINPTLPARPGVECVFVKDQPDGSMLALLKELRRGASDKWLVRQHNPAREFELEKRDWPRAFVVAEIRRAGL